MGLAEYLVHTLSADHPYREVPHAVLVRELTLPHERQRFMGLRILHEETVADGVEIMFYARIFEKGADQSFVELSRFSREGDAWRFATGSVLGTADLPADVGSLRPDDLRDRSSTTNR